MMKYFVVILLFGLAVRLDAYLILQMRKANRSDVDTVIHKHDVTGQHKSTGPSRRRWGEDVDRVPAAKYQAQKSDFRLGLDTGARRETNGMGQIIQMLSDAFDRYFRQPQARAMKSIQFRDDVDSKRSLALELKSASILRGLEDFLSSPKVKKAASELARKAAIVYRAIENEL